LKFGEMEFGEMKRNTSNCSNFCMLLRREGFTASAGLSCFCCCALESAYWFQLYMLWWHWLQWHWMLMLRVRTFRPMSYRFKYTFLL